MIGLQKVSVEKAVGLELCHDITAMKDGFKGAAFRRGHIITEEDIPKLLDLGKRTVFVWEAQAGEIRSERRETVRSLSIVGAGDLRRAVLSTRGPGWTYQGCISCHASGTAG